MIIPFLKQFSVFNIEDIEGIEFDAPELQLQEHEKIQKCEDIISGMKSRPDILTVNPNQPYYNKQRDYVNMPDMGQFNSHLKLITALYSMRSPIPLAILKGSIVKASEWNRDMVLLVMEWRN
jgi:antirestriction protein ArdC